MCHAFFGTEKMVKLWMQNKEKEGTQRFGDQFPLFPRYKSFSLSCISYVGIMPHQGQGHSHDKFVCSDNQA